MEYKITPEFVDARSKYMDARLTSSRQTIGLTMKLNLVCVKE